MELSGGSNKCENGERVKRYDVRCDAMRSVMMVGSSDLIGASKRNEATSPMSLPLSPSVSTLSYVRKDNGFNIRP